MNNKKNFKKNKIQIFQMMTKVIVKIMKVH